MSLLFRKLQLSVFTSQGPFGVGIAFKKGLNIIRADNSSGKSTCVQSIIYALGLESMLGTSNAIPLPHAVTHALEYHGEEIPVSESWVALEIENGKGEVVTVQRFIKSADRSTHLVSVWQGAQLSRPAQSIGPVDYFVRMEGAAQRREGFHRFLNSFIGWDPPLVARYDESKSPLYAECIFPLTIVEQKHGWSGIQARIPTHFRIREAGKRAVEFILSLDVQKNISDKEQARSEVAKLKAAWVSLVGEIKSSTSVLGGIIQNVSDSPPADFAVENRPIVTLPRGEKWLSPAEALNSDKRVLSELVSKKIPQVKEAAKQVEDDLRRAEAELGHTEAFASRLLEETEAEELQLNGLTERLRALREDLQHNKDALRLRKLGSKFDFQFSKGLCPTCQQPIKDMLLEQGSRVSTMSLDENISFIESQVVLFEAMKSNAEKVLEAKRHQLNSFRNRADSLRSQIRACKKTLVSDDRVPSEAAIRERLELEARILQTERLDQSIAQQYALLARLTEDYNLALKRLRSFQGEELSHSDRATLSTLERSFIDQIRRYGLSSVRPESINISDNTYRPSHEGFDLGFDLSASDMIRTIWAYLNGLLETARVRPNNHPGFLIFDEPRQQEAARVSFKELLARVSESEKHDQQVIFATSEEERILSGMLSGISCNLISFRGKILKPVSS